MYNSLAMQIRFLFKDPIEDRISIIPCAKSQAHRHKEGYVVQLILHPSHAKYSVDHTTEHILSAEYVYIYLTNVLKSVFYDIEPCEHIQVELDMIPSILIHPNSISDVTQFILDHFAFMHMIYTEKAN